MSGRIRAQNTTVRVTALAAMGAGLILVGTALAAVVLGNNQAGGGEAFVGNGSVVPAKVDFRAPALYLRNLSGLPESLEDYSGRVILVNNWATWCPPCKAEMPTLQAYYDEHVAEGLTVIAIEAGSPAAEVKQFARSFGLTFPIWVDPKTAALEAFNNASLPNSYVIDRTGTVRLAWVGEIDRDSLEKHVAPLLSAQ